MNTSRIAIAMGVFGLGALALLPTLRSGDSQARGDGSEDRGHSPVATPRGDLVDLSWAADLEDPTEPPPIGADDDPGAKGAAGGEERRVHPDDPDIIEIIPKNQPWTWEDAEKFRQRMEGARDEYAAYAAYPPWSRPYDGSQKHLVEWDQTTGHEQSVAETEEGEQIYAHAKLSSLFAGPGEPLYAVVEVWKGTASSRQPVEVVVEGEVRVPGSGDQPDKPSSKLLATVPFHPAPGGFQYTASFVPSQLEPLVESGAREAELVAWVIAGNNRTPFDLTFHFVTTPSFEVLDLARDAIVEGSLDVTLVTMVHHLQPVHVTAVLFHQETEQPIAVYDDYVRPTRVGRQEVTVRFFGKALREAGKDGPYFVGALHGRVEVEGQRLFWREERRFATKRYKSTDFSGEEWASEDKDEKLIQYDRAVEDVYP